MTLSSTALTKPKIMNKTSASFVVAIFLLLSPVALATQADDTTITIDAQTPGATPFIEQLTFERESIRA